MPRPKPVEPWAGDAYSVRLTARQRVALAELGGSQWLLDQINLASGIPVEKKKVVALQKTKPVALLPVVQPGIWGGLMT